MTNKEQAKVFNQAKRFLLRNGLCLDGFSEEIILKIIDRGLIKSLPDIYRISKPAFRRIPNLGKRFNGEVLYHILHDNKKTTMENFISGLGIPGVSRTKAVTLCKEFGTIGKMMNLAPRDLYGVKTIGFGCAVSILEFFDDDDNIDLICELRDDIGVHW